MTTDTTTAAARPAAGLLVVTVDGLPAWMLPAYGATWVAMPAVDSLAARGVVFDRVITPSTDPRQTLRDLAGSATGDGPSLVRAAAARGWKPALVTDDPETAAWFAAAIDAEVTLVAAVARRDEAADDGETALARLVEAAIDVIRAGRHRLVWCHVASLGVVWDAPRRYRDRYVDPEDPPPPAGAGVPAVAVDADTDPDALVGVRQVFAGQLSLFDAQMGRLFAAVTADADASDAPCWTVLLAGVRGLPLGLHGWVGVGGPDTPFGDLVHVPAVLVDAVGRMAAQRYGGLVVPADLGETLADLVVGVTSDRADPAPASPWRGDSLAGLFTDWSATARDRVVAVGGESVAIVTPSWHCLWRSRPAAGGRRLQLFAKPDDFFELSDVADRCSAMAEPLAEAFARAESGGWQELWRTRLPETEPA